MKSRTRLALAAMLALVMTGTLLAGCGGAKTAQTTPEDTPAAQEQTSTETTQTETNAEGQTLYTPSYKPTGKETAVIKTSKGVIKVELYGDVAPLHVGNFVELARKGFYDKTRFHRYEPGFVIQGGDPQTKGMSADEVAQAVQTGSVPLGTGGPGYVIRGEFDPAKNPKKHVEGALGMARAQDPDSAGSQFYFALQPLPQLDGQYTVFGAVTEGMDVLKALRVGDEIVSVTINGAQ